MAFAQLSFRERLRDIEACLRWQAEKLYHMGIRGQVSRNTLSNANATGGSMLQILSLNLFEKAPLDIAFSRIPTTPESTQDGNQLILL